MADRARARGAWFAARLDQLANLHSILSVLRLAQPRLTPGLRLRLGPPASTTTSTVPPPTARLALTVDTSLKWLLGSVLDVPAVPRTQRRQSLARSRSRPRPDAPGPACADTHTYAPHPRTPHTRERALIHARTYREGR